VVAVVACVTAMAGYASPAFADPPATSLAASFDNVGIAAPSAPTAGDFDGVGDAYSSTALAADGLSPGVTLLHDGLSITWPDAAAGTADNVLADGQAVAPTGNSSGDTLGIVTSSAYSAGGGGVTGTFTVNYADGTTTSGQLTFADWADNSAATGTDLLATGEGLGSGLGAPVSLYYGSIPLDPSETVSSVTLPSTGATVGSGVPALHVFDLTVGSTGSEAAGAPGSLSYYDQADKDCVGTAANTTSQTWYTVADGTLSDVYDPTIDNTDVKSLDPIVTGRGAGAFTALQPRDMTYTVSELGTTGMACRVVALDTAHDFAIVTDYVTNPNTDAVVMQESLVALPGAAAGLQVYLRFNPLLNGHGGGGTSNVGGESATIDDDGANGPIPVSYSTNSFTEATNRTYATPIYAAMAASNPFTQVESGFVGAASDGLTELDASQTLTSSDPDADDGNVAQTVELSFATPSSATTPSTPPAGYRGGDATSSCTTGAAVTDGAPDITAAGIASAVGAAADQTVTAAAVQSTTVALGFGAGEGEAVTAATSSATVPFATTFERYQSQWQSYDQGLCAPPTNITSPSPAAVANAWWLSANVLKASEDKTFVGATAASLASPWGQSVPAGNPEGPDNLASYFGSYREVFPRDAYETFTGFMADGDLTTAQDMVNYWFDDLQLPNGSFPRNGLLNGQAAPDTAGLQLDETADPILAAWQAGMSGNAALYQDHIKPAADFLVANGPETSGSVERWEEQTGYSPSTMADEVAGLVAAAAIATTQGDTASARLFDATADNFRNLILETTVTSNGSLSSSPYFIRLSKDGDPNDGTTYSVGNGNGTQYDQRTVIDQGFTELIRQGELSATSPLAQNSMTVADNTIDVNTPSGTGVLRYNGDGYGDCYAASSGTPPDNSPANQSCPGTGEPWAPTSTGTGHPWPVLTGENGEFQIAAGQTATATNDLDFMLNSASGIGLVPEQVWDDPDLAASPYGTDPTTASIGFTDGKADGSAAPLTWAQSQELRLIADLGTGNLGDTPSIVAARYQGASATATAAVPLSVTAPLTVAGENVPTDTLRPVAAVDGATTTVTGTTAAGATVDVAVTGSPLGATRATTTMTTTTAGADGSFSVSVAVPSGSSAVEVATTTAAGTNEALFSLDNSFVAGTVVLQASGAAGGGSGPGTYVYPTATNGDGSAVFPPNSFNLNDLTVIDSGSTSTIEVGVANLQNVFGALGGLQLIDVYVHAPSGAIPNNEIESTAPAGPADSPDPDNYTISPDDAWNQLIQVDAQSNFGTDEWVTPSSPTSGLSNSTNLGTPQVSIAQLPEVNGETPGLVTITLPTATFGTPGNGWAFTVTLDGQGGTDSGNAAYPRQFTATPGQYTFGVCAPDGTEAICSADPNTVPNVMDTIPPAGVSVQSELDPTNGPVALQGVPIGAVTPTITWSPPDPITYGTALSSTQLDATANIGGVPVAGTYSYTHPAGSVLSAGSAQTLEVTFTPTNTTDYTSATATTTIDVNPAPLTVTANDQTMVAGHAVPSLTYSASGFVNGDTMSVLSGTPTLSTTATSSSPAGSYPLTISAGTLRAANYQLQFANGTLTVTTASPPPTACDSSVSQQPLTAVSGISAVTVGAQNCRGYYVVDAAGQVRAFGGAKLYGDLSGVHLNAPIVSITATADGSGYYLLGADGGVFSFGDAVYHGSTGGLQLNAPVVGMAVTPDGGGYWIVAKDGGIFSYGDATFHGSTGNLTLNAPVDGIAVGPGGHGYWLVASDGGVFAFDEPFVGSMGGQHLNAPVIGMSSTASGSGYTLVAADGGVFSFAAPFYGSLGATPPLGGVVALASTPDDTGYYVLGATGAVYSFGPGAVYFGGAG
jgi:glucoamylase